MLILQLLLITGCALALCCYVGWGLARLALPEALRPFGGLCAPLLGYVAACWCGYMGVSTALNLRWSLGLLLLLASALNLLAWRRGPRPRPLASLRAEPALLALLTLTLLAGLAPLLAYGYLTAIGQGWDTESYWPMAQHLLDYPIAAIPSAPANPLRDLVSDPPRIGLTLAFSVFQGMTMLLSGQGALATFAPLLALLRALGVLATYLWLRATMGLGRPAALLGAALTSAGALLLWVMYFNFGMQLSSLPLLPLSLMLALAVVEELGRRGWAAWPTALLGGLTLAALPVAYYPVLSVWAPLALALGLARLIETRRISEPTLPRLLLAALALGLASLPFAALPIADYFQGFSFRYSVPGQKIGPDRFIALTDILGLTAFRLPGDGAQPPSPLVWLALGCTAVLALAALLPQATRATPHQPQTTRLPQIRWTATALALVGYLLWMRYGQRFEYGYMKGSAYAGLVAWGLVAAGAQAAAAALAQRLRPLVAAAALLPLLVAAWSQVLIIGEHARSPAIFTRDAVAFSQATQLVPPGASVAVSNAESFTGPIGGLWATLLYGRSLWGHMVTAYANLDSWPEGALPEYALLAADERPWPLQLGGQELWRSQVAALYRLPSDTTALFGRSAWYGTTPPDAGKQPLSLALWRRAGPNRSADSSTPLTLLVGQELRIGPGTSVGGSGPRPVTLTLASMAAQTVTLRQGATTTALQLPAGVSRLQLSAQAPDTLELAPAQPLALIDAAISPTAQPGPAAPTLQPERAALAWRAEASQSGPIIQLALELSNPARHALRIGVTVVEDSFTQPHQIARLLAAAPLDGGWRLSYDPVRGATEAQIGGAAVPLLDVRTQPSPPDGSYFGVLTLYDGEAVIAQAPVFSMQIASGAVTAFQPVPFTIEASTAGPPAAPLPGDQRALLGAPIGLDSGQAVLAAALLTRAQPWPGAPADAPVAPGATLGLQLFWQADQPPSQPLMISLQVLGSDDRKLAQWDGLLGGDWQPIQVWQPDQQVRQDLPLTLDPATPPGSYRLLLVVYDPASGQPQPLGGQSALLLGQLTVQ